MVKHKLAKKLLVSGLSLTLVGSAFAGIPPHTEAASITKTIALNPEKMKKHWDGWGTALAWFGNVTGGWEDVQAKESLVDALYSEDGLNYNIARYNIGGGDDPNHTPYMRQGGAVPGFSTGFDETGNIIFNFNENPDANQRWWLLEARERLEERNSRLIAEAFSNSAPYYMTHSGYTSGHTNATETNLKDEHFTDFANYLAEVVQYYKEEHDLVFDTLSPINEPNTNYWRAGGRQEGSHWSPSKQSWIIWEASQALERYGLRDEVRISAMEESVIDTFLTNWSQYTDDTKSVIDQMNVHAYGGNKRVEVRQLAEQENKKLWMSEVDLGPSGVAHDHNSITPALALADQIMVDIKWFEPQAWVLWQAIESEKNMLPDQENMNWGLIHADFDTEQWYYTKKYYAMAQFSKFIPEGSRFFENDDNEGRTLTAYSPEKGEVVIVYRNPDSSAVQLDFDISKFAGLGSDVDVYTTSQNKNLQHSTATATEDKLTAEVEARSITTFIIKDVNALHLLSSLKAQMENHLLQLDHDDPEYGEIEALIADAEIALQQDNLAMTEAYVQINRQFSQFSTGAIPKDGITAIATSSHTGEGPELTIDGSTSTMWHTSWGNDYSPLPHSITYDLGKQYRGVYKLEYVPRQDKDTNGTITQFMIEVSEDGTDYVKVAEGHWDANKLTKSASFNAVDASHIRFTALASQSDSGYQFGSAAEITLYRNVQFTVDKSELEQAISDSESFIESYTRDEEYLEQLQNLVLEGNELLASDVTTQEEVNRILASINEELDLLRQNSIRIKDVAVKFAPLAYSSTQASNMLDGNRNSFYETNWQGSGYRYQSGDYVVLDLTKVREDIGKIVYTPRQDMTNGRIAKFKIYSSTEDLSGVTLTGSQAELQQYFELTATGFFDTNDSNDQTATFTSQDARYIAIQAFTTGGNATTLSIGELAVYEMEVDEADSGEIEAVYENLVEYRDSRGEQIQALINEALNELPAQNELSLITRESIDYYYDKLIKLYESYSNYGNISSIRNGEIWVDTDGMPIQAHGGGILFDEKSKTYYWYGEDKTENNLVGGAVSMTGIHAYSSTDLYNWKNEGIVLPVFNNVRFGADELPDEDQPLYLSEDSQEYIGYGEPFSYESYQALPEITDRNGYYTGTLKAPYETLKKHNSSERIAELNALYDGYTNEQKQAMYRDFNWDKVAERPKVIYNEKNDNYVMWWHHDGPKAGSYWTAEGGVAVSDSPNGPFKYIDTIRMPNDGSSDGNDGMLRDMTLFVDDDGDSSTFDPAYLIYSSEENSTMIILMLNEDYTGPATNEQGDSVEGEHWVKAHKAWREAPAVFKQEGTYYMITSGLTGWNPNRAEYHTAPTMFGPWVSQGDPFIDDVNGTTHGSQSTFVLPYRNASGELVKDKYIFMADRWIPSNLKDSRYIWLPLHLDSVNKQINMSWQEQWTYSVFGEEQETLVTAIEVRAADNSSAITEKGGTLQMEAIIVPEDADNKEIVWSVVEADGISETDKASIDESGLLTALKDGEIQVIATAIDGSGVYGSKLITISGQTEKPDPIEVKVESITVSSAGNATTIRVKGGSLQLTASVLPNNAHNKAVTWSVHDADGVSLTDKASINDSGLLVAKRDGRVKVNATAADESGVVGSFLITISGQISSGGGSGNGNGGGSGSGDGSGDTGEDTGATGPEPTPTPPSNGEDTEAPTSETEQPVVSFTDVGGHWAENAIKQAAEKGIITGYGDQTVRPNAVVNRQEFVVMLMRALQPKLQATHAAQFTDGEEISSWAQDAIAVAMEMGIVNGYSDGSFRPQAEITRAEMVTLIVKALKLSGSTEDGDETAFADDDDIPIWAKSSITIAVQHGIVKGKGNNLFDPNATATRAEAITMLLRMLNN